MVLELGRWDVPYGPPRVLTKSYSPPLPSPARARRIDEQAEWIKYVAVPYNLEHKANLVYADVSGLSFYFPSS